MPPTRRRRWPAPSRFAAEIAGGAPFAEVAQRESSDSVSAKNGGDLGEWKKGDMDAAFDAAAFSLPLNALSQPVLSQFGYHIIQVSSRSGDKVKGRHVLIPVEIAGAAPRPARGTGGFARSSRGPEGQPGRIR